MMCLLDILPNPKLLLLNRIRQDVPHHCICEVRVVFPLMSLYIGADLSF